MKNKTLPVAVFVAILGCVLAVSANVTTSKIKNLYDTEQYKRLTAEQELQKAQGYIAKLQDELKASQDKLGGIENILNQDKSKTEDMSSLIQTLQKERDTLKMKLDEAMKAQAQAVVTPQPAAAGN